MLFIIYVNLIDENHQDEKDINYPCLEFKTPKKHFLLNVNEDIIEVASSNYKSNNKDKNEMKNEDEAPMSSTKVNI